MSFQSALLSILTYVFADETEDQYQRVDTTSSPSLDASTHPLPDLDDTPDGEALTVGEGVGGTVVIRPCGVRGLGHGGCAGGEKLLCGRTVWVQDV